MVVGTQIGAYRVLQQIGEGGMGTVWLAEHTMLGRRAALKLLHPSFSTRPDIVTRFFNEARAATAISDPGIVQIFDFGHHVDGSAYIAMEMLDGEPLDKRLRRFGRLPIADSLRIMRQVASTLGVAHQRGIIHRDLKPENVFLVRDPEVIGGERAKVLDFGIAKLTGDQTVKTNTSAVMGTPAYMSPEQCRGAGHVDQRSDVYALGCMLFALITGAPPFDAEGAGELIAMHLREPPPSLASRVPIVPPELELVMSHCLAKDPGQRYNSAAELAAALGALLGNPSIAGLHGGSASMPGVAVGPRGSVTTLSSANGVPTMPSRSSGRGAMFAGLAVLVVGGGVAAVVATRGGSASTAPPQAPVAPVVAVTPPPTAPNAPPGPEATTAPMKPATPSAPDVAAGKGPAGGSATAPVAPPAPTAPPAVEDPRAKVAAQMTVLLGAFGAWARDHAGAACPAAAALGPEVSDPWGHPLTLTCTDQPANQIIGAVSGGPDGAIGTPDDIASWQLGRELTDLVHGARWVGKQKRPTRPVRVPDSQASRPADKVPGAKAPPRPSAGDDDIPSER